MSQSPPRILLYAIVSPTPHSLEKFASIDAPERSGVASSRPSSDHVPALMKAQSGPTAGVA